ncbi:MAG: polyprenyl synthetase family protein [Gammaproteobacteria bacterium]
MTTDSSFRDRAARYRERVDTTLARVLPAENTFPEVLNAAMRYSVLGGGKRVRPLLTYATGEVFDVAPERLDAAAAAVELIHAFSLVHDDLPAMDDDDLRRGRPTTHKAYDEATAILAGDALQVLAFSVLAKDESLMNEPATQIALVRTLGDATGVDGMTGGQALDLASSGVRLELHELERMHERKTGVLIRAAILMAWHCATPSAEHAREGAALAEFARLIGLAFQIRDDILDVEGDTDTLGKPQGSDLANDKATYPAILGMDEAKRRADHLFDESLRILRSIDRNIDPLVWLAGYIVRRDH